MKQRRGEVGAREGFRQKGGEGRVKMRAREAYQEPVLVKHEPLVDLTKGVSRIPQ
jgi:hypothetical protein